MRGEGHIRVGSSETAFEPQLFVGNFGQGVYTQTGGSLEVADDLLIARETDSTGAFTVTGGAVLVRDVLLKERNLTPDALAQLTIGGDAAFEAEGSVSIGAGANVSISDNAQASVGGSVTIGTEGTLDLTGGRLSAEAIGGPGAFLFTGGTLEVNEITRQDGVRQQGGLFAVGSDSVQFAGDYRIESGTLLIDIEGTGSSGNLFMPPHFFEASDDAELWVRFDEAYLSNAGDDFRLVSASAIEAGFGTWTLPELEEGLVWRRRIEFVPEINISELFLSIEEGIAGDFNADGAVNAADYTVWRDSRGATGISLAADANLDGTVDEADYAIWSSNYGHVLPTGAAATPEPSTAWLVITILAAAPCRQERGGHRPPHTPDGILRSDLAAIAATTK